MITGADSTIEARAGRGPEGARLSRAAPWLRALLAACAAALLIVAIGVFTYQTALARIPEHRASLERLVRARTGLDVRFNELGIRWGWYGPEVVLNQVELGEPGRSNVLLRASALVVAFDAWRTLRAGHLTAGRITLVSPDIDIARLRLRSPAVPNAALAPADAADPPAARWLSRWPNGRVDVEGGTLSVPDPRNPDHSLVLQIRSARLQRADAIWAGSAQVLLPERLGRSLRVTLQLTTPPADPARLAGFVRLEGNGVLFGGWRELLLSSAPWTQYLPSGGDGTLSVKLDLREGRIAGGGGELRAGALVWRLPALGGTWGEESRPETAVSVGGIDTAWRLERGAGAWHLAAAGLSLGARDHDRLPASLNIEAGESGRWARATLRAAPLETLSPALAWLVPEWSGAAAPRLQGHVRDLSVDWQAARAPGTQLRVGMSIEGLRLAAASGAALDGVAARISGNESRLSAELQGSDARLFLATGAQPLENLRIASRIELTRGARGWTLATTRTALQHSHGLLLASGSLRLAHGAPLALHARLENADAGALRAALGTDAAQLLGPVLANLTAGRIPRAELNWTGRLGDVPRTARSLNGFVLIEEGTLSGAESWPALRGLAARLDFQGQQLRAAVTRGSSDAVQLTALKAQWRASGARSIRVTGQGQGEVATVLEWLRTRHELEGYAPALRGLDAHGPALFTFNVSALRALAPRVRVVARLDGVGVRLAPRLPPLESLRGTLAFDGGHLQRSTLEARWLGGTAQLRIAERRETEADAAGISVQGQGVLGAPELLTACGLDTRAVDVAGRTAWKGELAFAPATARQPLSWRAHAETSLLGIASRLPAPLAKSELAALPLRIDADGSREAGTLRVALGDLGRGVFQLQTAEDGTYRATRGAVRFGAGPLQLPVSAAVTIEGSVAQLDLPAWLAAWRTLTPLGTAPPLAADVEADELAFGNSAYGNATLALRAEATADILSIDSEDAAGSVRWPRAETPVGPVEAHFARLRLPDSGDGGAAAWLAALGGETELAVEDLTWQDRALGSLQTRIEIGAGRLSLRDLHLTGPRYAASGALDCAPASPCRLQFQLEASDAASTLHDFGFLADVTAEHAKLGGALEWPAVSEGLPDTRPWLERARGNVSIALADGSVAAAPAQSGRVFPLLGLAQLTSGTHPAGRFARLTGEFEIAEGNAVTSNLHFDGDSEILMSGSLGLAAHDYDLRAVILSGAERLPDAVRRLSARAAPHVAAAWLALRDLWPGKEGARARPQLHVGGTWEQPRIEPLH